MKKIILIYKGKNKDKCDFINLLMFLFLNIIIYIFVSFNGFKVINVWKYICSVFVFIFSLIVYILIFKYVVGLVGLV